MTCDSREHAIREMAYAKWEQAGYPPGNGEQFWLAAENEIQSTRCEDASLVEHSTDESILASFPTIDPPPLKMTKTAGSSRKKVG